MLPIVGQDPKSPEVASVVEHGFVEEVRDGSNAHVYRSADFLRKELRELNLIRGEQEDSLIRGEPRFLCAHCGVAVVLRLSMLKRWHFRHTEDDGSCRYQTKGVFSQEELDARRYNGQKEGPQHIRMKRLIRESIGQDSAFDQQSILEEIRWRGKLHPGTWKIPDLQAARNGIRFAFEIQLSSTYVNVMRERRAFYLAEGGFLFWILSRILEADRRQFQDDVLYPNNCNVFAVDDETVAQSKANAEFTLRCGYLEPVQDGWQVKERWRERLVRFSELTFDLPSQRVYFFDYDSARKQVERSLRTINGIFVLDSFEALLRARAISDEKLALWHTLKQTLPGEFKWPLDLYGGGFFNLVDIYLSARTGAPVGWDFKALIQSAHRCMEIRPDLLPFVENCFRVFDRDGLFTDKRYAKKWEERRSKAVIEANTKADTQTHLLRLRQYRPALEWLMPEVRQGIEAVFAQLAVRSQR